MCAALPATTHGADDTGGRPGKLGFRLAPQEVNGRARYMTHDSGEVGGETAPAWFSAVAARPRHPRWSEVRWRGRPGQVGLIGGRRSQEESSLKEPFIQINGQLNIIFRICGRRLYSVF
jgi:hypothetical protein